MLVKSVLLAPTEALGLETQYLKLALMYVGKDKPFSS